MHVRNRFDFLEIEFSLICNKYSPQIAQQVHIGDVLFPASVQYLAALALDELPDIFSDTQSERQNKIWAEFKLEILSCRVQKHLPGFPLELIVSLLHNSITTGLKES